MNYRISKLRDYLFEIINTLTTDRKYQINADMLSNKIDDFSLNKIPTNPEIEKWIIGASKKVDIYSFRSRKAYSQDVIVNLENIGFFEDFENIIKTNNDEGDLPLIDNIESIECLNCGTLNMADGNTAIFDIQIQVTYIDSNEKNIASL